MPVPTTASGQVLMLEQAYRSPVAARPSQPLTASQARQIRDLNKLGGFTRNSPYKSVTPAWKGSPRPLTNTPQGRQAINTAANHFSRVANSRPVQAAKTRLPAPSKVAAFSQTPVGGGISTAALSLGFSALDGEVTGQELAGAAGAGVGTTAGSYLGGALGGLLGGPPGAAIGAFVGGWAGGFLGQVAAQSIYPNRDGPQDDYSALGSPPWTGGQMPGVDYRVTAKVLYSGHPDGEDDLVSGPATQIMEGPLRKRSLDNPELGAVGEEVYEAGPFGRSFSGTSQVYTKVQVQVLSVERVDGQPDTGGNPPPEPTNVPGSQPTTGVGEPSPLPHNTPNAPFVPFIPPIPARAPSNKPQGTQGQNLTKPTGSAKQGGLPKTASKPKNSLSPSTGNSGGRRTPPPPTRTKSKQKCPCSKGILDTLNNKISPQLRQGAELGLLAKIDATTTSTNAVTATTLGTLEALKAFSEKAWKATRADKIINLLTLITTLHNASMISRDIGETLGYVLSNALAVVGIKDENDSPLDINQLVGNSVENFIKGIVGEDVYTDVRTSWQKANRVLQSASNIVWTIRNIHDTTSDILEWTAENTGKIGNALKRYGVVGERSYPWMAERVSVQDAYRTKLSRVFEGLENIEDTADSLAVVTSNVREIQEEVNELGQARDRFKQAVEDLAPDATPTAAPENIPVATAAATADQASQSPDVSITDADRRDPDATP